MEISKITMNLSNEDKEKLQNATMQISLINKKRMTYADILLLGIKEADRLWQDRFHQKD